MALDLRLQHKMVQQLVMTPQLQQAIKLLQLSHLEMAEVLREELEQNPVLEDRAEGGDEDGSGLGDDVDQTDDGHTDPLAVDLQTGDHDGGLSAASDYDGDADVDSGIDGDGPGVDADSQLIRDMAAVGGDDTHDDSPVDVGNGESERTIDWENYLDSYSYSLPSSGGAQAFDELPPFEATLTRPMSLHDHLIWQLHMSGMSERDQGIALMLIDEINDDGYLDPMAVDSVMEELGVDRDGVEQVLRAVQEFDPVGVASRDLRECLLAQAQRLDIEDPLVIAIIDTHLSYVERRNLAGIAKELHAPIADVGEAIRVISHLEPRPGRSFSDKEPQYITPDIYVHKVGDEYVIVLNEDGLPRLRISNYYRDALSQSAGETKSYIQDKLRSAAWLIRSIHMRQRTIYRVMESILRFQGDFFEKGVAHLKPLILKDVAEDVGMHESTISRVTTNKYVHTPQGIYELKYFFNSSINRIGGESIASESVREHIKRLIDDEDPQDPRSDQQLVEMLEQRNIRIARRTVAKYREMMRIAPSSKRKQMF